MGKLLPQFKKSMIDDITTAITANAAQYYAFVANPILNTGNTPLVTSDDFTTTFTSDWQMMFGKKLANTDILPVISNIGWVANTVYARYDSGQDLTSANFYVVAPPVTTGGTYNIYKCIDNAGGTPSTVAPNLVQATSFITSDGYKWRYITSITNFDYQRLATSEFIPVYPNTSIVTSANTNNGVEVVNIINSGNGYNAWANGVIQGVVNSTLVQIQSNASVSPDFYTGSGIYILNTSTATSQLRTVSKYVSNLAGNWVYLDVPANTQNIVANGSTTYLISPKVVFQTDGDADPSAYSIINPVGNSIASIVIINTGYGVSWANVVIQSNTSYGSGANVYAIVPPAGGHGSDPANELITTCMGISFNFANTEGNTIPQVVTYNKIGIVKNPYSINATSGGKTSTPYTSNTYISILEANVSPATTFTVGDTVTGQTTSALGTVAFSNSTTLYLTGDKYFANNETIVSSNGSQSATLVINTRGNIYTKDLVPLYIQNINNVSRLSGRTETFKLIIQI